jgi:hypothetical protein
MSIKKRIFGRVTHDLSGPVENAEVRLIRIDGAEERVIAQHRTNAAGFFDFEADCDEGDHHLRCQAFGKSDERRITVEPGRPLDELRLDLKLEFRLILHSYADGEEKLVPALHGHVGKRLLVRAESAVDSLIESYHWKEHRNGLITELGREAEVVFGQPGGAVIETTIVERQDVPDAPKAQARALLEFPVSESDVRRIGGHISVTLDRSPAHPTLDQSLWTAILERTHAVSFRPYREFLHRVFELDEHSDLREAARSVSRRTELGSVGAYQLLKYVTEAFLLTHCGVYLDHHGHDHQDDRDNARHLGEDHSREEMERRLREYLGEPPRLPYLRRVIDAAFPHFERDARGDDRLLFAGIEHPLLIELFYEYWLEQGMVMQTIEAVSRRFQNIRGTGERDALANLEIDPLRPLNNILYAWDRAKPDRLSVQQRELEYLYGYGLQLSARGNSRIRAAEVRSNFLDAFHNLLYRTTVFYKEDSQTTVISDAFPVLNALKEVHLVLSQGAHNSFFGTTFQARVETLMMQFMLARPEMRDFLQSRVMVTYEAAWMPQVDSMKTLQGWDDLSVTSYYDLAVYGEQLLLSIRFGDWAAVDHEDSAKHWARTFKRIVLGFINAYRAVTGIDLTNQNAIDTAIPASYPPQRLVGQRSRSEAPGMLIHERPTAQLAPRFSSRSRRSN